MVCLNYSEECFAFNLVVSNDRKIYINPLYILLHGIQPQCEVIERVNKIQNIPLALKI